MKSNSKTFNHILRGYRHLWNQTSKLLTDPLFLALTIFGNGFIILNAFIFYFIEVDVNDKVNSVFDAVWWAFSTVTTVGYGDITPASTLGRVHGILLMLAGVAIFLAFTALFAKTLIEDEIVEVEDEVKRLEKEVKKLHPAINKRRFWK
jgi:voltage-gated potassium channel